MVLFIITDWFYYHAPKVGLKQQKKSVRAYITALPVADVSVWDRLLAAKEQSVNKRFSVCLAIRVLGQKNKRTISHLITCI